MCFLSYPQLHTLFYVVIILCCILYYPLLYSGDDVYVECPVFPQKWGLNEKQISFRFSLGNSTRLDSTRLDSTSVLGKSRTFCFLTSQAPDVDVNNPDVGVFVDIPSVVCGYRR